MIAANPQTPRGRRRPLDEGDPAPPISAVDQSGSPVFSNADLLTGKPAILVFCPSIESSAAHEALGAFRRLAERIDSGKGLVLAISPDGVAANAALHRRLGLGFPILCDADGDIRKAYGVEEAVAGLTLVMLDPAHRIARRRTGVPPAALAVRAAEDLELLFGGVDAQRLAQHAPLLLLPRVLGRQDCEALIARWHRPVSEWPSHQSASEGHSVEAGEFKVVLDSDYGRAAEYVVRDPELERTLDRILRRRLLPEIRKAFQTTATRRESYRISGYDSVAGGFLHPHRDNPIPAVAHRRFTVSINLNAGEYEGGALRFPEYGPHLYDVERGTAVVWSASLLHEVLPLTRGRRFILGTHLFGGEGSLESGPQTGSGIH